LKSSRWLCVYISLLTLFIFDPATAASFTAFESGQVRPLAISPDGSHLFVVNTPDNRLEIFDVNGGAPVHTGSVAVGMEPVAVAVRSNTEIWVANYLSDSVSIVDISATPRVTRTLLVGDEPADIVFAGTGGNRAFITTAHRGQNSPYNDASNPGELATPGIGRADVWVFNASNLGSSLGGEPLTIVTLFGDTPKALTVSPDGNTVYAAVFKSGNQTTVLNEEIVCDGGSTAPSCTPDTGEPLAVGGLPEPSNQTIGGLAQPEVGLIVKFDDTKWVDELNRDWSNMVRFDLPDKDVFAIDANANPPVETNAFAQVGTVLFNMAVNPVSGKLYVANTEAINEVRFEGSRSGSDPASTVQGHLHEARITVIDPATDSVTPRHLNKHIDYTVSPAPAGVNDNSLATPKGMTVTADGKTLFVVAKGSAKIGVFDTTKLENDTFVPDSGNHIELSAGGPGGLVLDEANNRLYVTTRFDNSISIIDTTTNTEVDHQPLHNPEPTSVVDGRRFFYDARFTSSNGEAACASCHVEGDKDELAWDLGDPTGSRINNQNPFRVGPNGENDFHPMKGPMTTQTFRGLDNHGPMHWRGDRSGANVLGDPLDEDLAFKEFNVAFEGLLGRSGPLTAAEMQSYTTFVLQITPPPNPVRALDDSLTSDQQAGHDFYFGPISDIVQNCNGCHILNPAAGFFGTDGLSSFEGETQHLKIPQLRNMYEKVGMFGMPNVPFFNDGDNGHKGDQIRGFGFTHDGSVDTLLRFHNASLFTFPDGDPQREQMVQFMFAFDTNLKPVVGQQVTLTSNNAGSVGSRIDLLISRAAAGDSDLIVKYTLAGETRGAHRLSNGTFETDRSADAALTDTQLRNLAQTTGQEVTWTAVPLGAGIRMGINRDEDTLLDGDDNCPAVTSPDQLDTDSDGAGNICDIDDDNDGLTDSEESTLGTDPLLDDTDGDGLSDGAEVDTHGTDPLLADTDDDGLSDSEEVSLGMNPSASNRGDLAPYSMPNGTLNIADVLVMNRILLGDITATATEITLGDLNNNGSLDIGDQVLLLRMVTGIIPPP